MNTLKTIQVLYQIGRIVSKIVFICCIVGLCINLAGILSLALGADALKLGGVTLRGLIENTAGMARPTLYAALAVGMVFCASEGVLSKFAELYCKNELADGDPFTLRGAKELLRLGILTVALPLAAAIVCSVALAAADHFYPGVKELPMDGNLSVGLGIMLIVLSFFCRHGAETAKGTPTGEGQ